MGYIKTKMIKFTAVAAVAGLCLTACGAVGGNREGINENKKIVETKDDNPETASKNNQGKEDQRTGKGEDEGGQLTRNGYKAGNMNNTESKTDAKVPIYREGEEEAVQNYLSKLPDQPLSFAEAKKLGVILEGHMNTKQKEKEYFGEQWLTFYTNAKKSKKILDGKWEKDIATRYEEAVVIMQCTIEGDPIYKYISYSFQDGMFYLYEDTSRDHFGSGDNGFHDSYYDVKWNMEEGEDRVSTDFYMVKERKLSSKEFEKKLKEEDYDGRQLFRAYSIGYLVDTIDGMAICRGKK